MITSKGTLRGSLDNLVEISTKRTMIEVSKKRQLL
jgi:hypothetical protein